MFYNIYFGGKRKAESLAFGTNIISSKVLITLVFCGCNFPYMMHTCLLLCCRLSTTFVLISFMFVSKKKNALSLCLINYEIIDVRISSTIKIEYNFLCYFGSLSVDIFLAKALHNTDSSNITFCIYLDRITIVQEGKVRCNFEVTSKKNGNQ